MQRETDLRETIRSFIRFKSSLYLFEKTSQRGSHVCSRLINDSNSLPPNLCNCHLNLRKHLCFFKQTFKTTEIAILGTKKKQITLHGNVSTVRDDDTLKTTFHLRGGRVHISRGVDDKSLDQTRINVGKHEAEAKCSCEGVRCQSSLRVKGAVRCLLTRFQNCSDDACVCRFANIRGDVLPRIGEQPLLFHLLRPG